MGIDQFLVLRAEREGSEKEKAKNHFTFVKSLLTQTDFPSERIAKIANVTAPFAAEVMVALGQSPN